MVCPYCGASLDQHLDGPTRSMALRFCPQCGRDLDAVTKMLEKPDSESGTASGWLSSADSINHGRFAPGVILDGRYRVIGLLGRGGMGEVYRADDLRLGQPVALKFLPADVARDAVRLAQFHNEVRTARQVSHPNICRVYDIGEIEGQLFLTMEFVAGEDLSSSLRRIGRFPEDRAIEIARQLCAGLAAAHERGVIHRDLKPANVMLDDNGKVRLMDFGLAAVGAVEDIRVGTPAYMAPEQLLGKEVTARSDIYALGLVLYELFTGRRAFTASTLKELIEQQQSADLTAPSSVVATLDSSIERAILRCLERDPAQRPASALAVAAALPGGDPLAAALAAGETPSPEMVAAAGEGTGLDRRAAWSMFVLNVVAGVAAYAMALTMSPLDRLQPEYNAHVLAQKARDVIRQLGIVDRADNEAFAFQWNADVIAHLGNRRERVLRPDTSPLEFWYRRSPFAMTGLQFHDDLLTPGIVSPEDPPPVWAGMAQVRLDHRGMLRFFETIPRQRETESAAAAPTNVDWAALIALAGVDATTLREAPPQWNWLASADTQRAWTGVFPGTSEPLRIEAAARDGRPVAFLLIGPWTRPWREAEPTPPGTIGLITLYLSVTLVVLIAGGVLARRNLRAGRGDRAGASTLGAAVAVALWALWLCRVHLAPSIGLMGNFLVAVVTTVFYAALFWALYLAIEPFVRRYWPSTLMSWTAVLRGRWNEPIVGRDVLFGVALGLAVVLLIQSTVSLGLSAPGWQSVDLLLGFRSWLGETLGGAISSIRSAVLAFFLLFLLRVVLRHQWIAAVAFASLFGLSNALGGDEPLVDFVVSFINFGLLAIAAVRWGFTALFVAVMVANWWLNMPVAAQLSSWWITHTVMSIAVVFGLTVWGLYASLGGRLWRGELLR